MRIIADFNFTMTMFNDNEVAKLGNAFVEAAI